MSRAVETARGFEIHDVIGPDELHEQVNNSGFTNAMAAWTLRRAADLADSGHAPAEPGEPEQWRSAADRMVILRTEDGLIEEHEGFMALPLPVPPDERAGRDELAWQRDRMEWRDVKQADIVMLMALLEPQFDAAERAASYRLYEPLTRHLSSLSEAVHSLVARRSGMDDEADDYLRRAMAIDLEDSRGNRAEGLHMATQGGLWQAVVLGCAGARALDDGSFRLDPRPPRGMGSPAVPLDPPRNPAHRHRLARRAARRGGRGGRLDHGARLDGRGARGRAAPARRRLRRLARRGLIFTVSSLIPSWQRPMTDGMGTGRRVIALVAAAGVLDDRCGAGAGCISTTVDGSVSRDQQGARDARPAPDRDLDAAAPRRQAALARHAVARVLRSHEPDRARR